ncbi:MAG: hypothetical protein HC852_24705 [Acaryochloridaceae cyanobacterium RU_4_10]|nr:hypothetical protein [Acaryochloridaceae cyanobacterium RU_4_10]
MKTNHIIVSIATVSVLACATLAVATYRTIAENNAPLYAPDPVLIKDYSRCYPSTYGAPEDVKTVNVDGATYWEMQAKSLSSSKKGFQFLHLRTEGKKCKWLNRNRATVRLDYMPKSVAVNFVTQQYKPTFDRCKVAAKMLKIEKIDTYCAVDLQKTLAGTYTDPTIFFPEERSHLKPLASGRVT